MPPRFILCVVNRATLASALGAGEPAPARKVHIQIEPTILDRKLAARHRPRQRKTKGQLEKIGVSHPLTINSIPTDRSPCQPKKQPYPLHSARSHKLVAAARWARILVDPRGLLRRDLERRRLVEMDDDALFRALADASRRRLLDR